MRINNLKNIVFYYIVSPVEFFGINEILSLRKNSNVGSN